MKRSGDAVCQICGCAIGPEQAVEVCPEPKCRSPYHRECWDYLGGCARYGCPKMVEVKKGEGESPTFWGASDKQCPLCAEAIPVGALECPYCKALFQDYLRYVNTNFEIGWGLKTVEFEGLPMIASKFMPVSSNARKLAVLSTDTLQMRVLQDVTYEELAKTNDSVKFMLKVYEALICTAEQFNAQITSIYD